MKTHLTVFALAIACVCEVPAVAQTPGQRPYELEWANRHEDTRKPLIDFEDLRRCLFMHPPYARGVGYSYAELDPVQLPDKMPAALRCEIGKADGSDLGDGMLFQVTVVDSHGHETIVAERSWIKHAWTPLEADLSNWRGQKATIKLRTDVGPGDNSSGDWGCWSNLSIESLGRELVTEVSEREVELARAPAPLPNARLSLADVRSAQSGVLHFQAIGLQNGAPYVSQARLNDIAIGEMPAAGGSEQQGIWSNATLALTPEAIASLAEWNQFTIQNPGRDSFKIGRFWIELNLKDGRRAASQVTRSIFTQPADWLHAEGTGVTFDEDIELEVRFPLSLHGQ